MKQNYLASFILLAGLALGGAGCTSNIASNKAMPLKETGVMEQSPNTEKETGVMMKIEQGAMIRLDATKKTNGEMMVKGVYEDFFPEKISWAKDGKVILFFKASWCSTCQEVDSDIQAHLGQIPSKLFIFKIDYNNSTELKKKYGVTYQHTFVQVDANGTLIKKWSGSPTLTAIVAEVQ